MVGGTTEVLSSPPESLSPRILRLIAELDAPPRPAPRSPVSRDREPLRQRLRLPAPMTVPGIGPIISSAVVAATGSGFKQGRDFAAWLGLVPKQESTGDRTKLGRVSPWQQVPAHPLRAGCPRRPPAATCRRVRALWPWIDQAARRLAHRNLLAIALANKLARIAWALLSRGRDYQPRITSNAA